MFRATIQLSSSSFKTTRAAKNDGNHAVDGPVPRRQGTTDGQQRIGAAKPTDQRGSRRPEDRIQFGRIGRKPEACQEGLDDRRLYYLRNQLPASPAVGAQEDVFLRSHSAVTRTHEFPRLTRYHDWPINSSKSTCRRASRVSSFPSSSCRDRRCSPLRLYRH